MDPQPAASGRGQILVAGAGHDLLGGTHAWIRDDLLAVPDLQAGRGTEVEQILGDLIGEPAPSTSPPPCST
jgi:hypothetical protein